MSAFALVIGGAVFFWLLVVSGAIVVIAVIIGNFREGRLSLGLLSAKRKSERTT